MSSSKRSRLEKEELQRKNLNATKRREKRKLNSTKNVNEDSSSDLKKKKSKLNTSGDVEKIVTKSVVVPPIVTDPLFEEGQFVKAPDGPKMYRALIVRRQSLPGCGHQYFVHFVGWARRFDLWLDESFIAATYDTARINLITERIQKPSSQPSSLNSTSTGMVPVKVDACEKNDKKTIQRRKQGVPNSKSKEEVIEIKEITADMLSAPESIVGKFSDELLLSPNGVKLRALLVKKHLSLEPVGEWDGCLSLPNELIQMLVVEWKQLHQTSSGSMLINLPKATSSVNGVLNRKNIVRGTQTVKLIIDDYLNSRNSAISPLEKDLISGLPGCFSSALPSMLLYSTEVEQYKTLTSLYPNVDLSDLYGGEHLLRFFVCFPRMLEGIVLPPNRILEILQYLQQFLVYLAKEISSLIHPDNYIKAADAVIQLATARNVP